MSAEEEPIEHRLSVHAKVVIGEPVLCVECAICGLLSTAEGAWLDIGALTAIAGEHMLVQSGELERLDLQMTEVNFSYGEGILKSGGSTALVAVTAKAKVMGTGELKTVSFHVDAEAASTLGVRLIQGAVHAHYVHPPTEE